MQRITLKDVAVEAGISVSCSARALKGRPGISSATRKRVQEIAEQLGYRPDPMLSALATYREASRSFSYRGNLAYFSTNKDEAGCLANREAGDLFRGARERADALGYHLEHFTIGKTVKAQSEIWKTLRARGINGAVLRSFPMSLEKIVTPPESIACIDLFSQPHSASMPTVSSHHAQSMEIVLQKLLTLGYQKPAIVLNRNISESLHHGWQMAFKMYAERFSKTSLFLHEGFPIDQQKLTDWTNKFPVDALIFCASENMIPNALNKKGNWGSKVAIISMDIIDPNSGLTGIYQDRFRAGATAISMLHSMLMTGNLGVEIQPSAIMIPGTWQEGKLLPRK